LYDKIGPPVTKTIPDKDLFSGLLGLRISHFIDKNPGVFQD
jgi:hypothetical protein